MKILTPLIKSQPLPKLSTVFCAHRRSLLREPISIVLRKGALIAQTPELAVQIMIAGRQRTTRFTNP